MTTADRPTAADAWGFVPGAADGVAQADAQADAQAAAHAETERRLIDALTASGRW